MAKSFLGYSDPPDLPPSKLNIGICDRVRAQRGNPDLPTWFTVDQLAAAAKIEKQQAQSALSNLRTSGEIVGKSGYTRGRGHQQTYRWVTR